jgi:H+/Cl- antiporter ClcA
MLRNEINAPRNPLVKIGCSVAKYFLKWLIICLLVGMMAGTASALFLISLDYTTQIRETHHFLIALLPVFGLLIGYVYYRWGKSVVKGNNQILNEYHLPTVRIPFRMAPMILFSTLATHLGGGSAGREGTAVQMGTALADQLIGLFQLNDFDRRILLICGMSASFASVFGTPLAGAVFAIEVLLVGRVRIEAVVPSFLSAFIADYVCSIWGAHHTHYVIPEVPGFSLMHLLLSAFAGIAFGWAARSFSMLSHFLSQTFHHLMIHPIWKPFLGGTLISISFLIIGTKYAGLGIPVMLAAFESPALPFDFAMKILFTAFTLSVGFKGGEVTPLFFIGATLGSALSIWIPLPVALLAGMGFVAVFSGATNTPIACLIMGMELFGISPALYLVTACLSAYFFSGRNSIYVAQMSGQPRHFLLGHWKWHSGSTSRRG